MQLRTNLTPIMNSIRSDGSPLWNEIYQALLQYRNTSIVGIGVSPAQLLFGRRIKDLLPTNTGLPNMVEG